MKVKRVKNKCVYKLKFPKGSLSEKRSSSTTFFCYRSEQTCFFFTNLQSFKLLQNS